MKKLMFILVFLVSITSVYAWTGYTHKWICDKINLTDTDCAAADKPKVQSEHPDLNFKNHHCTGNLHDCSARTVAAKYLVYSYPEAKGYAAHLYSDSMVPAHWYSTDYDTCHKIFEDAVEEKIRNSENVKYNLFKSSYDLSVWNVSMICPAKFGKEYKNVTLYADNLYMDITAKYVADQMYLSYAPTVVKTRDLTPLLYCILIFLILIFTLFVYMGMKNRPVKPKKKK
jgi:hypothetical protein